MLREDDYRRLLIVLLGVTEANKGVPAGDDHRMLDAEGLAQKFFFHAASALYLYRSTTVQELRASFFDPASVNVLCRAALETFLVFHYVFVAPKSDDERDCRYISWVLGGYLDRQRFPVWSPEGRRVIDRERSLMGSLVDKLKGNHNFQGLSDGKQRRILKGEWKLPSWTEIGHSVGLHELNAKSFYSYLCGYAHAGNLSVVQMRQADTAELQQSLCTGSMGVLMIAMAHMVMAYCHVFEKSRERLVADPEAVMLVDVWVGVGASGPEDVSP